MNEDSQMTTEHWLAIRKEAGKQIDPETAEVEWTYAQTLDPYGVASGGVPASRARILRPFSRRRRMGLVWRPARRDPRRLVEKAQVTPGVSCGPRRVAGDGTLTPQRLHAAGGGALG